MMKERDVNKDFREALGGEKSCWFDMMHLLGTLIEYVDGVNINEWSIQLKWNRASKRL